MTTTPTAVSTWTIDPVHTTVGFEVQHMGMATFRGRFRNVEGTITLDEANPTNSTVAATIDVASLDIVSDRLAGHLNSQDFFVVETYPAITFRSTRVTQQDDTHWTVIGDLTIRDTTREVALATTYLGQGTHPFSKRTIAGFHAETAINRGDFGLNWNVALDTGAQYVGERVTITLDIEAIKQDTE
jgi:polyisoprenoid-binding protein YceI